MKLPFHRFKLDISGTNNFYRFFKKCYSEFTKNCESCKNYEIERDTSNFMNLSTLHLAHPRFPVKPINARNYQRIFSFPASWMVVTFRAIYFHEIFCQEASIESYPFSKCGLRTAVIKIDAKNIGKHKSVKGFISSTFLKMD